MLQLLQSCLLLHMSGYVHIKQAEPSLILHVLMRNKQRLLPFLRSLNSLAFCHVPCHNDALVSSASIAAYLADCQKVRKNSIDPVSQAGKQGGIRPRWNSARLKLCISLTSL